MIPESGSDESSTDTETCKKCGKQVSPFDMPEHLDFHFAKELQENEKQGRLK